MEMDSKPCFVMIVIHMWFKQVLPAVRLISPVEVLIKKIKNAFPSYLSPEHIAPYGCLQLIKRNVDFRITPNGVKKNNQSTTAPFCYIIPSKVCYLPLFLSCCFYFVMGRISFILVLWFLRWFTKQLFLQTRNSKL